MRKTGHEQRIRPSVYRRVHPLTSWGRSVARVAMARRSMRRSRSIRGLVATSAAILMVTVACSSGGQASSGQSGQSPAEFYKGKTVKFSVGSSPGGGYDTYARLLAPYLGKALGAKVVVSNEPGAGGLVMLNNLASETGDQASTHIALFNGPGIAGAALAGGSDVRFDLTKLSYLGRIAALPAVFVVSAKSSYKSMADVEHAKGFKFGATGKGSAADMNAQMLIKTLSLDATVVTAFPGSSEAQRALLAGDIEGMTGSLSSRLPYIKSGQTRALLVLDTKSPSQLKKVPNVTNLKLSGQEKKLWDTHISISAFHRPVAAPPGIPKARLHFLRQAFHKAMTNPAFIKATKKANRPVNYASGQEMQRKAQHIMQAPQPYKELSKSVFG